MILDTKVEKMIGDNIILQPEITQGKDLVEEVLNLVNKVRIIRSITDMTIR